MEVELEDDLELDAGLDDTEGSGDDTTDDDEEDQDDAGGDEGEGGDDDQDDDGSGSGGTPLYKQAKAQIEKIKAEDPKLAKKLQLALVQYDKSLRALPDGAEKAATILRGLSELAYPGKQGLTTDQILAEAKSELQGWRQFDVALSEGDPKVLEELADAAPDAFQKLVPEAVARYATINPEAYSTMVAQAVMRDVVDSQVPMQLQLLEMFIAQLPKEAVQGDASSGILAQLRTQLAGPFLKLKQWFGHVDEWAKKPIELKKVEPKAGAGNNQRGQGADIETRELDVRRREWNTESTSYGNTLISSETARLFGTKLTDKDKQKLLAKVADELDARLSGNREYGEAMRSFLKNNNLEGYKRRLHSEYKKLIPGAVARAGDDLKFKRVKQKPGAADAGGQQQQQQQQQQRPRPQNQQRPAQGQQQPAKPFEPINGHPRTLGLRIDLQRTPSEWLNSNPRKAILVGGRRVRWKLGS